VVSSRGREVRRSPLAGRVIVFFWSVLATGIFWVPEGRMEGGGVLIYITYLHWSSSGGADGVRERERWVF
jgi:hypothetical protein